MVDFRCKHPIFILNTESGPAFADMNTKPKQNRARSELNKHDIFCLVTIRLDKTDMEIGSVHFYQSFLCTWKGFELTCLWQWQIFVGSDFFSLYTKFIVQHLLVPCLATVVVFEISPTSLSLQFHPLEMIDFALDGKLVQD